MNKRGRPTTLDGAEVVETYADGQAKTYLYKGTRLSRREYKRVVNTLKDKQLAEEAV